MSEASEASEAIGLRAPRILDVFPICALFLSVNGSETLLRL